MHGTYVAHIHTAVSVAHGATRTSVITAILGGVVVLLVLCGIVFSGARFPPPPGSGVDDDPDSGWGRGGGGPGPDSGPPQPETGPSWWPEFERQFAAHVARYVERDLETSHADGP
jgi:hypothetical protein